MDAGAPGAPSSCCPVGPAPAPRTLVLRSAVCPGAPGGLRARAARLGRTRVDERHQRILLVHGDRDRVHHLRRRGEAVQEEAQRARVRLAPCAARAPVSAARPAEVLGLGQAAGHGARGTPTPSDHTGPVSPRATPPAGPRQAQRARRRPWPARFGSGGRARSSGSACALQRPRRAAERRAHRAAYDERSRAGRRAASVRAPQGGAARRGAPRGAAHRRAPCRRSSSRAGSRARWTRCALGPPPAPPRPARPPPRSACAPAGTCARPRPVRAALRRARRDAGAPTWCRRDGVRDALRLERAAARQQAGEPAGTRARAGAGGCTKRRGRARLEQLGVQRRERLR